jgi:hypothetical protein
VFQTLQVVTLILVAFAMAMALAHVLELPGKLRLSKDEYLVVQTIYYPGFTIGGASEPAGMIALLLLVLFTPAASAAFWLTLGALGALAAAHAVYWTVTHPVNNFWLKDFELKPIGAGFFSFDPLKRSGDSRMPDWTVFRDRWEYSHVVRAGLALLSLTLLATAVAL